MIIKLNIPDDTIGIGMTLMRCINYDLKWEVVSLSTDALKDDIIDIQKPIKERDNKNGKIL